MNIPQTGSVLDTVFSTVPPSVLLPELSSSLSFFAQFSAFLGDLFTKLLLVHLCRLGYLFFMEPLSICRCLNVGCVYKNHILRNKWSLGTKTSTSTITISFREFFFQFSILNLSFFQSNFDEYIGGWCYKKSLIRWLSAVILALLAVIGDSIIINECCKGGSGYITIWNATDILSYYGTVLGVLVAATTMAVTIFFNRKQLQRERFLQLKGQTFEAINVEMQKKANRLLRSKVKLKDKP